jgi:hypothetical protein
MDDGCGSRKDKILVVKIKFWKWQNFGSEIRILNKYT